jgi:mRNA interferase MazF
MDGKYPRHGEIWLAALDPAVGGEIGKTRPAVVLSNDTNNRFSDTVTIIPITSNITRIFPYESLLPSGESGLPKDSKAKANQIRTIDKVRLRRKIGEIAGPRLDRVKRAVKVHLSVD